MTRGLLLDLGNVLVRFDHGRTLERLHAATGAPEEVLRGALFGELEASFDRGELSPEAFFRQAERRAGIPRIPDEVWVPSWRDIFTPEPAALALLGRLAHGVRTALVSNTNVLHWEGVKRVCDVHRRVDVLSLSFEVGACKPDPALLRHALRSLGVGPSEAVYADDRAELVEAARRDPGVDAFVVSSPEGLREGLELRGLLRPREATGKLRVQDPGAGPAG